MSKSASKSSAQAVIAGGVYTAMLLGLSGCTESALPVPDLSGQWGRDIYGFEAPASGLGPVFSRLKNPDGTMNPGAGGDYTNPILKPQAIDAIKKHNETELSGLVAPNPNNQCWPQATPFILGMQEGVTIIQQRNEVVLFYLFDHHVRHVQMNARHPARIVPSSQGHSVGYYEGDMLVIDTIGQKIGPLSIIDFYGTPIGERLHVIERYRLIDGEAALETQRKYISNFVPVGVPNPLMNEYGQGDIDPDTSKKGLQVEITVEDPDVFTAPWSAVITYRPLLGGGWPEVVCAENAREFGQERKVPTHDTPDF